MAAPVAVRLRNSRLGARGGDESRVGNDAPEGPTIHHDPSTLTVSVPTLSLSLSSFHPAPHSFTASHYFGSPSFSPCLPRAPFPPVFFSPCHSKTLGRYTSSSPCSYLLFRGRIYSRRVDSEAYRAWRATLLSTAPPASPHAQPNTDTDTGTDTQALYSDGVVQDVVRRGAL